MAEDPLDQLMSATVAMEGDDAKARRAALPFAPTGSAPARQRVDYLWHDKQRESEVLRSLALEKRSGEADPIPLGDCEPLSVAEITSLYEQRLDDCGGRLLCLVRGELSLSLDPVEQLRATLSAITPFLPNDAALRQACDAALDALEMPFGLAPAIAGSHKDRVEEKLRASLGGQTAGLDAAIARACIENRAFARRRVFGDQLLRGMLAVERTTVPTYISVEAAELLPLMQTHSIRAVVEVRPSQDVHESHPLAFRALALGRELP